MRSRNLISPVSERLLEITPEVLGVLEPDRDPQQTRWNARALPTFPCLDPRRDTAEARHVRDQPRACLDTPCACCVCDVERHEPSESRIANDLDGGMASEPIGDQLRRLRLARHPHFERLQAPEDEPCSVGGRNGAGTRA